MRKKNIVNIDYQTFSDLEIFESSGQGQSIFELFDFTKTTEGKAKLTKIFHNPLNQIEQIKERQEIIKFILKNPQAWELPVTKEQMDFIEIYYY